MNTEKLIKEAIYTSDAENWKQYEESTIKLIKKLRPEVTRELFKDVSDDDMLDYDSVDGLQKKFDDLKTENISVNSIVAAGDTYIEVGALKSVVKEINTNKLDMQKNPMCVRYKNETVVIEW